MGQNQVRPVTISQALKEIPVSREALYRKLKRGELPHYKFGGKVMVDVQEILAAMRKGCSLAGAGGNETETP